MAGTTWAYRIAETEQEDIERGIDQAPQYGVRVASAIRRTIEVIHGLADLHEVADLDQIDVYLGRATRKTVLANRFRSHREDKGHRYGAILFTCDAGRVNDLESLAIKLIRRLQDRDCLCVGNVNTAEDARGRPPGDKEAVIYITWKSLRDEAYDTKKPTIEVVREVARQVAQEVPGVATAAQIETGLKTVKRLSQKARLAWWPDY